MSQVENAYFIAALVRGNNEERCHWTECMVFDQTVCMDEEEVDGHGPWVAKGSVKWDGCSNWQFNTHECMLHACDRKRLEALGDILAKCWDATKDVIPETWAEDNKP